MRSLQPRPGAPTQASSFPAPGPQGTLAQLDTPHPVMYLEFPQGRLKLFGTLVFPKARSGGRLLTHHLNPRGDGGEGMRMYALCRYGAAEWMHGCKASCRHGESLQSETSKLC